MKDGSVTAEEMCKSWGGRPGLPVPNSPHGLCGRESNTQTTAQQKDGKIRSAGKGQLIQRRMA